MADTFDEFPIVRDYVAVQHSDWAKTFTYKIDGVAVNLTGYTAEMTVWDDAGNVLTNIDTTAGIVLGGALGTIAPTIGHAALAAMPYGAHNYTLWLISSGGLRTPFMAGKFSVRRAVWA
jgi:hypothetical protein